MKKILLGFIAIGLLTFVGCEKEEDDPTTTTVDESKIPVVTTLPVDSFGPSNVWASAYLKGIVVSENGGTVTGRGFCWDTLSTVDINSNKSENGAGTGNFSHFIDDLEGNKPYFVRAYAINSFGTAYGDAVYFLSEPTLAKVTTTDAVSISISSATLGGNVVKNRGAEVTERGVCWNTSPNPTTTNSKSASGSGIGGFTVNSTGLKGNTTYFARAYAINSVGTSYGDEVSFTTTSSVEYGGGATDIDGNTYKSVIIGEQEWMAENLRTTKYSDGNGIPNVTGHNEWSSLSTGAWCNYDNSSSNDATYGKLYNWYAVNTNKLCPTGWHVPTDAEWTVLTDYLAADGHSGAEGNALKSTSGWNSGGNGTDDYGWLGLPGGFRSSYDGGFNTIGSYGAWWIAHRRNPSNAWYRLLKTSNGSVTSSATTIIIDIPFGRISRWITCSNRTFSFCSAIFKFPNSACIIILYKSFISYFVTHVKQN